MSMQRDGNNKPVSLKQPVYKDGRTKQTFKDETDINKILARAQKTGTISHINKFEGSYGDFSDFDFFEAQIMLTKGREIFDALPSEIRSEFNQSQAQFFAYVNDPANKDDLLKKLPGLAAPGRQNLEVVGNQPADLSSRPQDDAQTRPAVKTEGAKPKPADTPPTAPQPAPASSAAESSAPT